MKFRSIKELFDEPIDPANSHGFWGNCIKSRDSAIFFYGFDKLLFGKNYSPLDPREYQSPTVVKEPFNAPLQEGKFDIFTNLNDYFMTLAASRKHKKIVSFPAASVGFIQDLQDYPQDFVYLTYGHILILYQNKRVREMV